MTFLEQERRTVDCCSQTRFFRDPGKGMFSRHTTRVCPERSQTEPGAGIRDDAIRLLYTATKSFGGAAIRWHSTGHLAVVRKSPAESSLWSASATNARDRVAAGVDEEMSQPRLSMMAGRVRSHRRASISEGAGLHSRAHCTSWMPPCSVRTRIGERRMFLIEWKYTETYAQRICIFKASSRLRRPDRSRRLAVSPQSVPRDLDFEPSTN